MNILTSFIYCIYIYYTQLIIVCDSISVTIFQMFIFKEITNFSHIEHNQHKFIQDTPKMQKHWLTEDFKQYFLLQKTFILASLTSYWRKTPINRLLYTCRRLRAPTNAVIFFWSKMFFVNIAETKGFLSKENIDVSTFLKPISQEKPFIFNYKFNLNQKKKRRK